ncbi:hypothetical protein M7I_5204 [Glarea lozoyensis 74030]|uniref:Uncharacterized protein n=1 Tax=Glarea lozoyensis (strain ATCC 74030 / MF5533) TaxID=1104152 RepID=H0ER86_GLAL7|nr:hypothetical protein M7I_5204 [Glarea lozoyensis 74030]
MSKSAHVPVTEAWSVPMSPIQRYAMHNIARGMRRWGLPIFEKGVCV